MSAGQVRTVETVRGIVLREVAYKEADKILTVLTEEHGKITVTAHGVRSMKSRNMAATMLLCYSEWSLEKRGDRYTLKEAILLDNFYHLRDRLERFAFAQYAAELLCDCLAEEQPEPTVLKLLLNSLFAAEKQESLTQLKAAFELRLLCETGFTPQLEQCEDCGKEENRFYLDAPGGTVVCESCLQKRIAAQSALTGLPPVIPPSCLFLSPSVLAAMRYVLLASPKRIFAFHLPPDELTHFAAVCERFLLEQFGRSYDSLLFYHQLEKME